MFSRSWTRDAGVAHPVERHLAKVEVASSSLVTRSIKNLLPNRAGGSVIYSVYKYRHSKSTCCACLRSHLKNVAQYRAAGGFRRLQGIID